MKQKLSILCTLSLLISCISLKKNQVQIDASPYAIAYNVAVKDSLGKSNYEVFTMDFNGSNKKNITDHKDVAWAYHGFKDILYFISDRDTCYRCYFLYKTDKHGKNIQKISDLQLEDSFMDSGPKGKELIVSGRKGKEIRNQLFIINTVSGGYTQLTRDTQAWHNDPVFSPDGKQIVFAYKKNKRDRTQNEEIYSMNIDGTGLKKLTSYPQDNASRNDNGYKAAAPRWHPTDNFITYISIQNGQHNIYAVSPDGKKQWRLTNHTFAEGWHDWSSDGHWLVFDSSNADETQYHIMLMNWETKEVKQLTDASHKFQQSPAFIELR